MSIVPKYDNTRTVRRHATAQAREARRRYQTSPDRLREFRMGGRFCHPDEVFEIFVSLPILLVEGRHRTSAAFLDYLRHPSRKSRRGAQPQDLLGSGERSEQFQNIGSAVKAGLSTGI